MKHLNINLPSWLTTVIEKNVGRIFQQLDERMQFVIELQRQNVKQKTGGPFAAAVFEQETGLLTSVGVNVVEQNQCCIAHAEILALHAACQNLQSYSLRATHLKPQQLVSSGQMCIMCFGAVIWSGISEVVYAATQQDIKVINGFDEGPVPENWQHELTKRQINVIHKFNREQALVAHRQYQQQGGCIYNAN